VKILEVQTLNITQTKMLEKGLGTTLIEKQYLSAIKKYLKSTQFDLVLYSTPPITLVNVVKYIKKRDNAYSYLLLKDIFPQNAVDMKMLRNNGFIHQYFKKTEKKLYKVSDKIGCMSQANVNFILKHNPEVNKTKVEENPNSIAPQLLKCSKEERDSIRKKYNLPINKNILIYGGNFGKPQGLDFLLETIVNTNNENVFYLLVGSGTEFIRIKKWFEATKPDNAKLIQKLPKMDYDKLLPACDVGLIFLHKNFSIPNFPSRLLSYLEMKMPVIAATDVNSDVGDVIEEYNCGLKVISGDMLKMKNAVEKIIDEKSLKVMKHNSWRLLIERYQVGRSYNLIVNAVKNV